MGYGVLPTFMPSRDDTELTSDGGLLAHVFDELEELAEELEVPPLSSFTDNRQPPDGFDGDPDDLLDLLGPWDEWFPVELGISTFSRLADALQEPTHAAKLDDAALVREELRDYLECLASVDSTTTKFRLDFVP